jgi:hypothetical protein
VLLSLSAVSHNGPEMNRKGAKNAKFSLIFVSLCALCVLTVKNNVYSRNNTQAGDYPGWPGQAVIGQK